MEGIFTVFKMCLLIIHVFLHWEAECISPVCSQLLVATNAGDFTQTTHKTKQKPNHQQRLPPHTACAPEEKQQQQQQQTYLLPPKHKHKLHPREVCRNHWTNLTHQGQKTKGRRNLISKPGEKRH